MKTIANTFITFRAGHFGFATVCALLLTGGVYAKVAVDRFGNEQGEFCNSFNHPSQFYLWCEAHRQKTNAVVLTPGTKTSAKPVTSATDTQVLP
jgi:hypothetical protein